MLDKRAPLKSSQAGASICSREGVVVDSPPAVRAEPPTQWAILGAWQALRLVRSSIGIASLTESVVESAGAGGRRGSGLSGKGGRSRRSVKASYGTPFQETKACVKNDRVLDGSIQSLVIPDTYGRDAAMPGGQMWPAQGKIAKERNLVRLKTHRIHISTDISVSMQLFSCMFLLRRPGADENFKLLSVFGLSGIYERLLSDVH